MRNTIWFSVIFFLIILLAALLAPRVASLTHEQVSAAGADGEVALFTPFQNMSVEWIPIRSDPDRNWLDVDITDDHTALLVNRAVIDGERMAHLEREFPLPQAILYPDVLEWVEAHDGNGTLVEAIQLDGYSGERVSWPPLYVGPPPSAEKKARLEQLMSEKWYVMVTLDNQIEITNSLQPEYYARLAIINPIEGVIRILKCQQK